MTLQEAIDTRISRRKYLTTPIDASIAAELNGIINDCARKTGLNIRLVLNDGSAFNGLRKSYGMFSGVNDYIGLIAPKDDPQTNERLGYYGEAIVLRATLFGLGTCWVGGSFDRKSCPFELKENEMIVCTVAIGNAAEELSFKEKLVRRITHRKTKGIEDMYFSENPVPDWFLNGMAAVQKAPSAVNRQPVKFTYTPEFVTAGVENYSDVGTSVDLGIAKLHFELGAGGGKWEFGNNGKFMKGET